MRLGASPSGGWDVGDLAIHSEQTNSIADAALEGAGTTSLCAQARALEDRTRGDEAHLKLNYRRALAREGYCVVDADASLYRANELSRMFTRDRRSPWDLLRHGSIQLCERVSQPAARLRTLRRRQACQRAKCFAASGVEANPAVAAVQSDALANSRRTLHCPWAVAQTKVHAIPLSDITRPPEMAAFEPEAEIPSIGAFSRTAVRWRASSQSGIYGGRDDGPGGRKSREWRTDSHLERFRQRCPGQNTARKQ